MTSLPIRNVGKGKKPWMLDARCAGGGREFYATEDEAIGARRERLAELRNFGTAVAGLSAAERGDYVRQRDRLSPAGATVQDAVDFYLSHFKPKIDMTLGVGIEQMLDGKTQAKRRLKYVRQLGYDLAAFAATVGRETKCGEIMPNHVQAWLHGNGWEPKTILGKFISLQTFFSHALKQGWCAENPCAKVERIAVDYKRPGILTVEQCERLMAAAQGHPKEKRLVPYLALALFAGVRPEEIKQLDWSAVSDGNLRIESEQSKVRQHRVIPLSENCKAWLALGGELPPVSWQMSLMEVRRAAGFEWSELSKRKGERTTRHAGISWPHNCLRHSFVSYALPVLGVAETARQAGNSEEKVHHNYKALVTKSEAEKFWRIIPA